MAIFSRALNNDDKRQLIITQSFSSEPFPSAAATGKMVVGDEQGSTWRFDYRMNSRGERVLSGYHWGKFLGNNGVKVGDTIAVDNNDSWGGAADYKIEVIRRNS